MRERGARQIRELTERLSAYIDGELSDEECRQVEATLARDETARQVLSELRALSSAVGALPFEPGPAEIKERVLRTMERRELLGADAVASVGEPRAGWRLFQLVATAAIVGLAVGVGYFAIRSASEYQPDIELAQYDKPLRPESPPSEQITGGEPLLMAKGGTAEEERRRLSSPIDSADEAGEAAAQVSRRLAKEAQPDRPLKPREAETEERRDTDAEQAVGPVAKGEMPAGEAAEPASEVIYPEALTSQVFEAVANQVTITVPDHAAERVVVEQVRQFFLDNQLSNARELPPRLQLAQTQALYVEGQAGINSADLQSPQYLVRATPDVLNDLFVQVQNKVSHAAIWSPTDEWVQAPAPSLGPGEHVPEQAVWAYGQLEAPGAASPGAGAKKEVAAAETHPLDEPTARPPAPASGPSMANVPVQIVPEFDQYGRQRGVQQGVGGESPADLGERAGGTRSTGEPGPHEDRLAQDRGPASEQAQQLAGALRMGLWPDSAGREQPLVNVVIKVSVAEPATRPSPEPVE